MLIAACQQFGDFRNEEPPPTGPGKKLVVLPAEVWKQENCETRKLPYLRLDDTGITPQTVKPGESINYRFSYTACVPKQPGYILGRFQTEIFYKGKKLSTRYDDGYPVETGKLIVDTDIAVPRIVMPGSYTLKAKLSVEDATLYDSAEFTVVP
jgi:hypothetical protein